MQTIRRAVLLLLIGSNLVAADSGALSLRVVVLDGTVKPGAKIMIRVTTTNDSDHTITYHNTQRNCDYSLKIATSSGVQTPETPFKKQLNCGGGQFKITGRDISVTLKPHESDDEEIEITELYDISQPGTYTVQAERTFPGVGHFVSNTAKIEVTK